MGKDNPNDARLPMAYREAITEYVLTLNSVAEPSHPASDADTVESAHLAPQELTISIQLRQGWWEVRYHDPRPDRTFTTANEVHVPAGVRVAVELPSPNPASLVMDELMEPPTPGTTRLTLRASRPGLYRGRCVGGDACPNKTMPLLVVAEKGEEFEAWREHQLRGAEPPATRAAEEGREIFLSGPCIMCHTVRGTSAGSKVGPDLTHLGSRHLIAGGLLPRGRDTLAALIIEPARLKPGIEMPGTKLGPEELVRLVSYLESLR